MCHSGAKKIKVEEMVTDSIYCASRASLCAVLARARQQANPTIFYNTNSVQIPSLI